MVVSENGPGGDSVEPKGFGLLVEHVNSGPAESLLDFPEFGRLSRLHLCLGLLTMLFRLFLTAAQYTKFALCVVTLITRAVIFCCDYLPKICPSMPACLRLKVRDQIRFLNLTATALQPRPAAPIFENSASSITSRPPRKY